MAIHLVVYEYPRVEVVEAQWVMVHVNNSLTFHTNDGVAKTLPMEGVRYVYEPETQTLTDLHNGGWRSTNFKELLEHHARK